MSKQILLILTFGLLLIACTTPSPSPQVTTTPSQITATPPSTLIDCSDSTPHPDRISILPNFTPTYACELENVSKHVEFCMVYASPELSYPCSQTESIAETIVGEGDRTVLIQHNHHYSSGCWTAVSINTRSLRVCDKESGRSTTPVQDIKGQLVPSPDGAWIAFVDAAPGTLGLEPHIFLIRSDGTDLIQLDKRPFPQNQVVGIHISQWSEEGEWLNVSLWDGSENGRYTYHLRLDGSGEFERLP